MPDIIEQLRAPFDPAIVSWRVGSTNKRAWEADKSKPKRGQVLAYVDARDVMQRLDEVVGPANWQNRHPAMHNGTICCEIGIKIDGEWVWKANGAGATGDTNKESEREMAEKGGYSDAFKRAAVLWGVGQYLYSIKAPWIALDDRWSIPDSEIPALQRLLSGAAEPSSRSARDEFARIEKDLRACASLKALAGCWTSNQAAISKMPAGHRSKLSEEKDRCKAALSERADA